MAAHLPVTLPIELDFVLSQRSQTILDALARTLPPSRVGTVDASQVTIPPIGARWIGQGGVYAGMMRGINGGRDYHLIVSDEDVGGLAYGPRGTDVPGAACKHDGFANTVALVGHAEIFPAARHAAHFEAEGKTDYYLASAREARLCVVNVPELFKEGEWYWTSTQSSAYLAFDTYFPYGTQYSYDKDYEGRVRPVRRLIL